MQADWERIASDLQRILEEPEPEPEGLAGLEEDRSAPDLYALLEALTPLSQEIALHGRSFNEVRRTLEEFLEQVSQCKDGKPSPPGEWVDALLDACEDTRLLREGQERRLQRIGFMGRVFRERGRLEDFLDIVSAQERKLLHRLDALGVQPLAAVGMKFDPESMRAVDRERTVASRAGTVLEVYRQGYNGPGGVLRFAEVKVGFKGDDGG